jgi:hypothetical protein
MLLPDPVGAADRWGDQIKQAWRFRLNITLWYPRGILNALHFLEKTGILQSEDEAFSHKPIKIACPISFNVNRIFKSITDDLD